MIYRIPWIDAPSWRQEVALDGLPYTLSVHYNVRSQYYTLRILDRAQSLLVDSIRLVKGQPLLHQIRRDNLPPGELIVMGAGQPTRSNMGVGCQLYYASV